MSGRGAAARLSQPTDTQDAIRVMVVDDALVIRGMLSRMIEEEAGLSVIASVGDGERALKSLERHDVDVVVLDIEMPRMDGLTALPKIIEKSPGVQVLMASTLTLRNAKVSMQAMELGAADYIAKPSSSGELRSADDFRREFIEKVKTLGRTARRRRRLSGNASTRGATGTATVSKPTTRQPANFTTRPLQNNKPDVIAIGSSTGGPQALFKVLSGLGPEVRQPILITQHMPPTFTTILAEHIQKASGRPCKEGTDGEAIASGTIYVAPGDYHMLVETKGVSKTLKLTQDPPENFCRPAADPMLRSISKAYGARVLVVILTGMGSDGKKGAEVVVEGGGQVVGQDEASSVVWGMPGAVANAGLCSAVLPIDEIGGLIKRLATGGAA
ncbi:protein-glutamate methylesterase/protein-glutamine glutaminase [Hwanghaeella sp.]|uniref:protein-glutamate methylesterase/protein-glutamine glutaminase n=1 Tax=Hwanghaeella sp. TaxID=2605943 RepID=UPI003CCC01AF